MIWMVHGHWHERCDGMLSKGIYCKGCMTCPFETWLLHDCVAYSVPAMRDVDISGSAHADCLTTAATASPICWRKVGGFSC